MENCDNLTLATAGVPGGAIADDIASALKNFSGSIRHKAQLKQGLAKLQSGDLAGINGGMLDRIIESGVSSEIYMKIPAWQARPGNMQIMADASLGDKGIIMAKNANGSNVEIENVQSLKKYVPWILGAIVVAALIYFITK